MRFPELGTVASRPPLPPQPRSNVMYLLLLLSPGHHIQVCRLHGTPLGMLMVPSTPAQRACETPTCKVLASGSGFRTTCSLGRQRNLPIVHSGRPGLRCTSSDCTPYCSIRSCCLLHLVGDGSHRLNSGMPLARHVLLARHALETHIMEGFMAEHFGPGLLPLKHGTQLKVDARRTRVPP